MKTRSELRDIARASAVTRRTRCAMIAVHRDGTSVRGIVLDEDFGRIPQLDPMQFTHFHLSELGDLANDPVRAAGAALAARIVDDPNANNATRLMASEYLKQYA